MVKFAVKMFPKVMGMTEYEIARRKINNSDNHLVVVVKRKFA